MAKAYLNVNPGDKSSCPRPRSSGTQRQVLQDLDEQLVQLEEEALMRLEPPPMPKEEIIFWTSAEPHVSQTTLASLPAATRHSNRRPHFLHAYSNSGMACLFYRKCRPWSIRGSYTAD